ncbi:MULTISPECIES: hypothetical protein [unclassified Coleofasciculus]|uniref:hypothetical protein n=1 Tax=unclassified Coleofasciculus TaxID=2692782 RepID=UPI0022408BDE|nr:MULTISPECIES: hypothetical protein [unclassified Coleofasciculus]
MPYSSSLTDEEWEILEPLLPQVLPVKKQTRPCEWTCTRTVGWHFLPTRLMAAIGKICLKTCLLTQPSIGITSSGGTPEPSLP